MHRITFWLHQDTVGYAILREKQRLLAKEAEAKAIIQCLKNQCKTHAAGHTASQLWQFRNRIESSTDGYLT